MESKKRKKATAEWIGRPLKLPLRYKDEEDEFKEEYVGAPIASTEDATPKDEEYEVCEDDQEDDGI